MAAWLEVGFAQELVLLLEMTCCHTHIAELGLVLQMACCHIDIAELAGAHNQSLWNFSNAVGSYQTMLLTEALNWRALWA
jgi:predicted MFS family arabinose efflux permease